MKDSCVRVYVCFFNAQSVFSSRWSYLHIFEKTSNKLKSYLRKCGKRNRKHKCKCHAVQKAPLGVGSVRAVGGWGSTVWLLLRTSGALLILGQSTHVLPSH